MDCMKFSTTDDVETHRCVPFHGHTLAAAAATVGISVNAVGGWVGVLRWQPEGQHTSKAGFLVMVMALFKHCSSNWCTDRDTDRPTGEASSFNVDTNSPLSVA
jgi:hypothetical protein